MERTLQRELRTIEDPQLRIEVIEALASTNADARVAFLIRGLHREVDPTVANEMSFRLALFGEVGLAALLSEWDAGPTALDPILIHAFQLEPKRSRLLLNDVAQSPRRTELLRVLDGPLLFEIPGGWRAALDGMPPIDRSIPRTIPSPPPP